MLKWRQYSWKEYKDIVPSPAGEIRAEKISNDDIILLPYILIYNDDRR